MQSANALPPVLPQPGTDMVEAESTLLAIGVEEVFYRKGIGRMLMLEAIEFARHNNIEWIDLSVFGDNHAAIGLYRSLGFEEAGRRYDRFRISGRLVDDITMTLRIKGETIWSIKTIGTSKWLH